MKKKYVRPMMHVESFAPNEFVSACGDSNTVYKFQCDAGGGERGNVYLESNGQEGLQTERNGDKYLSAYHACGTTHEADTKDEFLKGYYIKDNSDTVVPVIVWRGLDGNNTHCTENLDMSTWEVTKS